MDVQAPVHKTSIGRVIRYAVTDTRVGVILLAATRNGVCGLSLGTSADDLEVWLREEFPGANYSVASDPEIGGWLAGIVAAVDCSGPMPVVPLDVVGSAFRRRVWESLTTIPFGETRTYTSVAAAIGSPTAVRAVARACATNPVSLLVPCHRVVGSDGSLRGYRWGLDRKRQLLDWERDGHRENRSAR